MLCDLSTFDTCMDVHFTVLDTIREEMPVCLGRWVSLPEPIPHGSYGTVFTARVTHEAPKDTKLAVTVGGKTIAVVQWGETRNWTCVPGSPELTS